ncbi:MAG: GAF domain-containing protein, partial [Chloroflexota bacterium]
MLRSRVVTALTLATLALAIWTHARPIGLAVQDQRWGIVAAWAAAGLWLLATALGQRIPHGVRAVSLLVAVAGMGLAALAAGGMSGSAVAWLLALPVVATLLLGLWGGLASLAVDIAGIAAVGWMLTTGRIPSPPQEMAGTAADPAQWIGPGVAFFVLGLVVAVALALILRAAQGAQTEQQELVAKLREENRGLQARLAGGAGDVRRQQVQIETAAEIAGLAAQTPEASELMARSVELIRERFDFYHASIFLLDATGVWAELVASTGEAGRQLLARKHRLAVGSASMIGWVTANQQPRVAGDVGKDPFHFKNPLLPGTRAEAAVPILVGTRLLGALDVQSTQPDAFAETDVRALEAIASELAIALDNIRLLRESRAGLGPEREVALATSWSRLVRTTETTEVHLSGAAGGGARPSAAISKEAAALGQPVAAEGGHEVAVPIIVRGQVVATIAARKPEAEPSFDDEDITVLQAVAGQAGQALEAARQYAEEQRRLAELEVVNRVSQAASQLLNLEALYRVLHSQIRQVLGETD